MHTVYLEHETDMEGWRYAARQLIRLEVAPQEVSWCVKSAREPGIQGDIFAMPDSRSGSDCSSQEWAISNHAGREVVGISQYHGKTDVTSSTIFPEQLAPSTHADHLMVPRQFIELARSVILHQAPERFYLLYRVLWRLQRERGLMRLAGDADVARLHAMTKSVRRDMHKMKAFVRFREAIVAGQPRYLAWFEPEHHIMAAIAPFFIGRFATMDWTIMSPNMGMNWDGDVLQFLPGGKLEALPAEDDSEVLWLSYYRHIFNPARLKLKAMQKEMPKKYWHNLPEAELIDSMIAEAGTRTQAMLQRAPELPRRKIIGYKRGPQRPDITGGNE
ncbi:TIGR03915 family putative DNA repair protein [Methylobacillus gramineus]|uniref:TIGR03915 family putative DNA repair protein n=1 Tax=Methylobacillus gramineus TaxID=755169 RepID=UPI001D000038|nr:TIGR03915 family putative DNA repair protein [Methylobacillus gramineus]MCB5184607.1 TIGR03915 family putative DNA repair protein [Methylobacillus gramineus]